MSLGFPEIVDIVKKIKSDHTGKRLFDSEVAALQCAWDGISYGEYVANQDTFTQKYSECYQDPKRSKTTGTIASCASRLFKVVSEHLSIEIDRTNFRRVIQDWAKTQDISEFTQTEIQNKAQYDDDFTGVKSGERIIVTQDIENIIDYIESDRTIISIYGAPGSGKTTLLDYISRLYSPNHDYEFIYTDLRYLDSFAQWAFEVLAQAHVELEAEEDILMSKLFELFDSINVLVAIDSIVYLDSKLKAFIETFSLRKFSSDSCIIISGNKKTALNISDSLIQEYQLKGLSTTRDIKEYFSFLGLKNSEYWQKMSDFYGGNFREIKYAGQFINDFFGGDVKQYWDSGSRVLSPAIVQEFKSVEFTQLDIDIFSMFSGDGDHVVSTSIAQALRQNSRTSEIWARINFLCDLGYLTQARDPQANILSYSIAPLLRSYLMQEGIIESER